MKMYLAVLMCVLLLCVPGTQRVARGEDIEDDSVVRFYETWRKLRSLVMRDIYRPRKLGIEEELGTLSDHPWAGDYSRGGYTPLDSVPVVGLILAPKGGFVYSESLPTCACTYTSRAVGKVSIEGDAVAIVPEFTDCGLPLEFCGGKMYRVEWGGRRYLVSEEDLMAFCNAVNSREEPGFRGRASFLLRVGDEKKKIEGLPSVPAGFRKYLLKEPVTAKVIGIHGAAEGEEPAEKDKRLPEMTLDVGRKQGVLPKMELFVEDVDCPVPRVVVVTSSEDTCRVRFSPILEDEPIPSPKIGWKVSSVSGIGRVFRKSFGGGQVGEGGDGTKGGNEGEKEGGKRDDSRPF